MTSILQTMSMDKGQDGGTKRGRDKQRGDDLLVLGKSHPIHGIWHLARQGEAKRESNAIHGDGSGWKWPAGPTRPGNTNSKQGGAV